MYEYCFAYDTGIKCINVSILNNGYCDKHQQYINDITKFDYINNIYCINIVYDYLDDKYFMNKFNTIYRKNIVLKLYEFLLCNKRFLYTQPKLANVTFKKLIEFYNSK